MTGNSPKPEAGSGHLTENFVKENHSWLLSISRRALGDPQAAEDLVQDVYIKCLSTKVPFRGESRYESYVARALQNEIFSYFGRRPQDLETLELYEEVLEDQTPTPEEHLLTKEEFREVLEAMKELPPAQQKVLALMLLERDHVEISELLGILVATSWSQMSRGIAAIKKKRQEENKKTP